MKAGRLGVFLTSLQPELSIALDMEQSTIAKIEVLICFVGCTTAGAVAIPAMHGRSDVAAWKRRQAVHVLRFAAMKASLDGTTVGGARVVLPRDLPTVEYSVVATTCDSPYDAGFDGKVLVRIKGLDGTTEEVELTGATMDGDATAPFAMGAISTFKLTAADVGIITSLEVRMVGLTDTTYWRPARLDVTNKITGQTAVYRYNSWMSTWSGAYTMEQQTITNWQVKLHNSTSPGQPTFKGKVFVKLDNGYCCSDEVEVSSGALLPGAITEPFSLSCPLSYLQYANVRVEGSSAPLCLRMVELINDSAGGTSTYFNNRGNPLAGKESVQLSSDTLVDCTFSLNTLPGQGAGLDAAASVYVQLLGDGDVKGEEVALPLPNTGCPPGSTVAITVKTFVVQPYSSIKLRVVGGQGPWALQRITVSDNYYCTNVLHNVSGKVAASGSVTLVKLQDVQYVIKTTTSDKAGADTDGELVVRLLGSKADSEPVWLIRSMPCEDADKALHALDRGAVNTFYISAVDVGEVQGVAISLATATDYNPVHSGLHLAGIAVLQTITGKETHFDHNKWVDASAPEVSLSGGSTSMSYVEWVVTVVTGSSGQLYGKLLASFKGSDGQRTHKMALDPSEAVIKTVAGGTQHTFKVLAASLTDISSMEVEMWSESIDYWMELVRVQAVVTSTRVMCLIKAAQQTMYRWNGSSTFNVAPCDVYYSITATTGPESSSRWDGSAYVTLHGADGDAQEHQLTSWDCSEFSLGANNSFYFYECDVGTIQAATIRTEPGSGSCKAWGLAYLDVTAYPSTGTRQAGFEPSQPVRANTAVRVERVVSITSYEITVTTSDLPGAGTDGRVFIKLVGAQGESEEVQLINGPEDFTRNATSVFTIQTSDVGDCREVAVRLEGDKNSGKLHSSWNCSSIQVLSTSSGMSFGFSAHQWIVREAGTAHLSQTSATQALSPYTVRVTTGTTKGASFEGEAFVVFKTWWGDSKEVRLAMPSRQKAEFRAGETAEFTVYAPKQWPPYAMDLRCVPTERDPMWNVERVVVVDPSSGDTVEFIGKTWLDKETSSVQLSSYCTPTQWKVVVSAGSAPDAGWDGSVWIMLEGVNGTSTYHLLNNDSGSAIIAGSASEFLVDLEDVGVPRRVQLKVEGGSAEGAARKWLCEHLEVTRVDTGRTWMFSNSTWADAGKVPLTLEVVLPPTEYSLVVTTSGQESDAFDGDAYVQIFGVDGSSEEHKLVLAGEVGGRPTFDLGSIVTCAFTTGDVGEIQYVSLRMDATGSKTTWGVTVVELTNTASNYRVRMPFGSQLNSNWYSCTNLCPERETVHKLLVVTKGQPEASWDGAVYFTLGNGWQNGKETRLLNDKGSDAFKAGASEEFTISSTDISWANQLKLRLEGGSTSSWGLERIELWNTTEVQTVSARVLLPQQPLTVDTEGITLSSVQRRTYPTVTLRMAADSEPFDGTVFLQLADSVGNVSNEVTLLAGGTHMLDAGTSVDLDSTSLFLNNPPTQALLRAERAGTASTWKPQSLSLVDDGCSSLLFVTQTSQTATLPSTLTLKGLKGVTYQVTVSTADLIGNGTDGAVYLTLTGEQGVSVERQLSNINLERGHTDFTNLELPDLGPLTSIKLVHKDGGAGVHSAWYCDTLDVLLVESGMQTRFAPAQWLEAGGEAVLEASGPAIQTYVPYEVTVVTQNSEGNGFDGVVQIMLEDLDVGQRTHTFLVGDGHSAGTTTGPFAPGASTTCSVLARDLGNVGRVHVQIVGTDNSNNWGLAEVVVKNIDRDQTWRFTYNSSMYSWYGWQPVELAPLDAPEELLVDLPAPTPERQASIPAPAEHEPEFPVVLAKEEEVEAEVEESPAPSEQSFAASEQRLSAPEVVPTPSDQFFSTAAPAPEPPPEKKGFFAGLGWGSKKADPTAKEPPAVEPPPEALMSPIVDQQPATSDAEVLRVVTPEASRTSAPAPEAPEVLAALLDEEESIAQEEPASPPDDEPEPLDEAAPPSDEEQAAPIEEEEEEGEAPAEAAADAPKEEAPPTPSAAPPEMLAEAFSKPTRMVDPLAEEDSMDDPFDNATVNDGLDSEFSRY